jgi:phage shock protein A
LFRADVHAVLDRIEEPLVLLQQAVREMEADLVDDEKKLKLLNFESLRLEQRHEEINQCLGQLEDELNVCFDHGKDDLARTLIRRKLEGEQAQKTAARKHESLKQTLVVLETRVTENRRSLDSMRQKAELLGEENGTREEFAATPDYAVREEDVEVAFLREKERRSAQ